MRGTVSTRDRVIELGTAGLLPRQISEALAEEGVKLGPNGVRHYLRPAGLLRGTARCELLAGWRVAERHKDHRFARRLRIASRARAIGRGLPAKPLTAQEQRWLDSFLELLTAEDAVVHYSPERAEGFELVRRRYRADGTPIDKDIVHDVRYDDEGVEIEG